MLIKQEMGCFPCFSSKKSSSKKDHHDVPPVTAQAKEIVSSPPPLPGIYIYQLFNYIIIN